MRRLIALVLVLLPACAGTNPASESPAPLRRVVLGSTDLAMGVPASVMTTSVRPRAVLTLEPVEGITLQWDNSYNVNAADRTKPRYLRTTYRVTNLREDDLREAVLVALKRDGVSKAGTAITAIQSFGSAYAPVDPQQVMPASAMTTEATSPNAIIDNSATDLQVLLPVESGAIEQTAKALGEIRQNDVVLDYGFVVRNASGGHVIPGTRSNGGKPGAGSITFSFRVPPSDNAKDDAYRFDMSFLLVTMDTARVTQGLEEQGNAALLEGRKAAAAASEVVALPGSGLAPTSARQACAVRTASAGISSAYLINMLTSAPVISFSPLPNSSTASAAEAVIGTLDPSMYIDTVSDDALRLHGSQTGAQSGVLKASSQLILVPSKLHAGEQVEVSLTRGNRARYCPPDSSGSLNQVFRYRIKPGGTAQTIAFGSPADYPSSNIMTPTGLAVGDIDGDSSRSSDVVIAANDTSGPIIVFINGGAGLVEKARLDKLVTKPAALDLADLDGDGRLELLALDNPVTGRLQVFRWTTATAALTSVGTPMDLPSGVRSLATGDIDADGDQDVVVAAELGGAVQFVRNEGGGSLAKGVTIGGSYKQPIAVALEDLDGDRRLDLIVADKGAPAAVQVAFGDGTGSMRSAPSLVASGVTGYPSTVVTGDWNSDGAPDVAAGFSGGNIVTWLNDGHGQFSAAVGLAFDDSLLTSTRRVSDIAVGDWNGDGQLDLAATVTSPTSSSGYRHIVVLKNAEGVFSRVAVFRLSTTQGGSDIPLPLRASDLTGDGDLEIVTSKPNKVGVFPAIP